MTINYFVTSRFFEIFSSIVSLRLARNRFTRQSIRATIEIHNSSSGINIRFAIITSNPLYILCASTIQAHAYTYVRIHAASIKDTEFTIASRRERDENWIPHRKVNRAGVRRRQVNFSAALQASFLKRVNFFGKHAGENQDGTGHCSVQAALKFPERASEAPLERTKFRDRQMSHRG